MDFDSGSRSDVPGPDGLNHVITVIPAGDSVQWQFFYGHSSTGGTCDLQGGCNPNGQWDSGIKSGNQPTPTAQNLHTVKFTQPGVFTYFCEVHLTAMRGIVVVLMNNQDYDLFANPDPTIGPPPPIPTQTIFAGGTATFAGNLNSYKNFISQVNLTCASGTPPGNCPTTQITVAPTTGVFFATKPFTFPLSGTSGGDFTFDIVGDAGANQPPSTVPFSHRKTVLLHVNDLAITQPSPNPVTVLRGTNAQTDFQAKSLGTFIGNVNLSCTSVPSGPACIPSQTSFFLGAGQAANLNANINTSSISSGIYNLTLTATSIQNPPGPPTGAPFTRSQSFSLQVRPAARFVLSLSATDVAPGFPLNLVVQAVVNDAGNPPNPPQSCDSTIQFSSNDPAVLVNDQPLPLSVSCNQNGNGVAIVPVKFNTVGPRTITATDTSPFATTGTSPVVRVDGAVSDNTIALDPNPAPLRDAYFRHEQVTFVATVTGTPGTPMGTVQFYDGAKPVGPPAALQGSGSTKTASKTFSLTVGDHAISAVFLPAGGSGFTSNMSNTQVQRRFPSPRCFNDPAIGRPVCPGSH